MKFVLLHSFGEGLGGMRGGEGIMPGKLIDSAWFVVFWEDEGIEEASPCRYWVREKERRDIWPALEMGRKIA